MNPLIYLLCMKAKNETSLWLEHHVKSKRYPARIEHLQILNVALTGKWGKSMIVLARGVLTFRTMFPIGLLLSIITILQMTQPVTASAFMAKDSIPKDLVNQQQVTGG